jgi:hypothetical protein
VLRSQYIMGNILMLQNDCITGFGSHIDCNLYFNPHVYFLFSYAMKLLTLIRNVTFTLSTIHIFTGAVLVRSDQNLNTLLLERTLLRLLTKIN